MTETEPTSLLQNVDDAVRADAKSLIRTARAGALSVLTGSPAWPSVSRIGLATDLDGAPIFPMSDLSGRTASLQTDNRVSLLIGEFGAGDPLAQPRITVFGHAERCIQDHHDRLRDRYLARHPKAKLYIDFKDFSLWRLNVERAHFIRGFGQAYALAAEDLTTKIDTLQDWAAAEAGAREHMNDDHTDAVRLYASVLAGAPQGAWRLAGIDPEGIDLALKDDHRRVWFEAALSGPGDIKSALIHMLVQARKIKAQGDETP